MSSSNKSEVGADTDMDADVNLTMQASNDKGKRKKFVTSEVCSALDRTKVTDRQVVHLTGATAVALGHDIKEVTLSRSTVRRVRLVSQKKSAIQVRNQFLSDSADHLLGWEATARPARNRKSNRATTWSAQTSSGHR